MRGQAQFLSNYQVKWAMEWVRWSEAVITIYHQARGLGAWGRTEADEEAAPDGTVLAGTRSMSMRTMHKSEFLYFNHKQHSFLTGKKLYIETDVYLY